MRRRSGPIRFLNISEKAATLDASRERSGGMEELWSRLTKPSCRWTQRMKVHQDQLDKLSMVVVSNSLRSNLTGMNTLFASQERMGGRSKRARDELAFLLQNRRRILVDMAFQLTIDRMVSFP
nr:unnamed protein product [Haemonchus contortus]